MNHVFTEQIFGVATDFEITTKTVDGSTMITVTTVLPQLRRQGEVVAVFAPPRWPWPNTASEKAEPFMGQQL